MKLYSGPVSLFTAKVRVALAEKGLAYERVEVGWTIANRYRPHHPDVVALNPKREVPILVDGGVTLYDSTVIFEYLEDRYPDRVFPIYHSVDIMQPQEELFRDAVLVLVGMMHHIPFNQRPAVLRPLSQSRSRIAIFEPLKRTIRIVLLR